jgi:hypothetical protein
MVGPLKIRFFQGGLDSARDAQQDIDSSLLGGDVSFQSKFITADKRRAAAVPDDFNSTGALQGFLLLQCGFHGWSSYFRGVFAAAKFE